MSEVITTVNSEIRDDNKFLWKDYIVQLKASYMSYHCYLAMILTRVPWLTMI